MLNNQYMERYMQEIPKHRCGEYLKYIENCIKKIDNKNGVDLGPIYHCSNCRIYSFSDKEFRIIEEIDSYVEKNRIKLMRKLYPFLFRT